MQDPRQCLLHATDGVGTDHSVVNVAVSSLASGDVFFFYLNRRHASIITDDMLPSLMTQKSFRAQVGNDAVVWIHPSTVTEDLGSKWPVSKARLAKAETIIPKALVNIVRPAVKNREPFVIPATHFGKASPITETARYQKLHDFIHRSGPVQTTLWFKQLSDALSRDGVAFHKSIKMKSETDILHFFDSYVIPLIESLRDEGFRHEKTGYEAAAFIDAEGRLAKVGSGNHRFIIGQILDIPLFPLRVLGVHADWYTREVMPDGDTLRALKSAMSRVEANHR
jgi:hypothetical protein